MDESEIARQKLEKSIREAELRSQGIFDNPDGEAAAVPVNTSFPALFIRAWINFFKGWGLSGRASRIEVWFVVPFVIPLFFIGLSYVSEAFLEQYYMGILIAALALFWLIFSLFCRRLHDIGFSAWMIFLALTPVIGGFLLLVASLLPGMPGMNRFGPPTGVP